MVYTLNCHRLNATLEYQEVLAVANAVTYIHKTGIVVCNCTLGCFMACLTSQMEIISGICTGHILQDAHYIQYSSQLSPPVIKFFHTKQLNEI